MIIDRISEEGFDHASVAALAGISAGAGPRSHILRREGTSLTDAAIRESGQRGRDGWGRQEPEYDGRFTFGIYEDNNPARRLVVIANHDNDVAEYWEWSGRGLFPIDSSNEAYKLGINYMLYGLTH